MEHLTPIAATPDADGGDQLFLSLLRAAQRSSSVLSDRLARIPADGDVEVFRPAYRAD